MKFEDAFFDIKKHKPQPGQVLARFRAVCEFVKGPEKRNIVHLLQQEGTSLSIIKILKNACYAMECDAIKIFMEIGQDLMDGMTEEQVINKPYEYTAEFFYYADPQNVPENDPHWSLIPIGKV